MTAVCWNQPTVSKIEVLRRTKALPWWFNSYASPMSSVRSRILAARACARSCRSGIPPPFAGSMAAFSRQGPTALTGGRQACAFHRSRIPGGTTTLGPHPQLLALAFTSYGRSPTAPSSDCDCKLDDEGASACNIARSERRWPLRVNQTAVALWAISRPAAHFTAERKREVPVSRLSGWGLSLMMPIGSRVRFSRDGCIYKVTKELRPGFA